ncbi:uncharacterized protein LOC132282183 [Cornus florida]|uniref:uncharacterized protein LOC132282183 n=1 Tax=Cornus florida TaxID=4283 RepID=UPI0028A04C73|nr:uncharacterized protein LOC132282183 [Cornus florida]
MVLSLFVKKGWCSLAFLVVILVTIVCEATSTSHKTFELQSCNGSVGECRVDEELELPMDPEISRRLLAGNGRGVTTMTINPGALLGANCDRNYGSCLPDANGKVNNRCQPYQKCRLGGS